jgi:diguanylate cyclase (GGDEF)-like protein
MRPVTSQAVHAGAGLVLVAIAVGCWIPVLIRAGPAPVAGPPVYAWAVFVAAFIAGELFPLRFEARRDTFLVSLSELPLVVAILLFPPWMVLVCYLGASLTAFVVRRDAWRGTVTNLALIAVESGIAVGTVELFGETMPGGDLIAETQGRYLPVAVGVLAGALASALAVGIIHRLIGSAESLSRLLTRSMATAAVVVVLALVGFTVWNAIAGGPPLCVALLVACILTYRSYAHFLRQHADLAQLYRFGDDVAGAGDNEDAWRGLVEQVRDMLGARAATLQLTDGPAGSQTLTLGPDGAVEVTVPPVDDPLLARARVDGAVHAARAATTDPAWLAALAARHADQVIVVALRSSDRGRGYLEVHDPSGRWGRFTDADVTLLQALGGHLATALDNRRLLERLRAEADHDPVTGLYNRSGLERRAERLAEAGDYAGVLLITLDVLSDVKSALGYDWGEQLLALASQRLADAAGPDVSIGRVDADGFAVLLGSQSEGAARRFAEGILRAAAMPIVLNGVEVEPTVMAGIGLTDQPGPAGADDDVHLQHARLALQSARSKGERLAVYRPAIGEGYRRRFQLASQFRNAVDSGRVVLHFQPKLTLADRQLIGVEALVRWMHPEYGFVSPAELVDAIEDTSSIDVLFHHVLDQALAQIVDWLARGMRLAIAVNLSVRNLLATDFTRTVIDAVERYGIPPELLTLEITESSVMGQPDRTLPILRGLHAQGIRLSVDDFGTGYSSLAYLRRLPIDELKIDKSFVQGMVTDLGDLAIVRAIIDLGHSLGLRVVAEGVEEEAGRDALRSMRCDAMQGFLLARPLPLERFETWLDSRTVTDDAASAQAPMPLTMRL